MEKDIDNKAGYSDSFTVISAEEGDGIASFLITKIRIRSFQCTHVKENNRKRVINGNI